MNKFFESNKVPLTDLGHGIKRKIIGYTNELMAVEVHFKKGAIGEAHTHDIHDQIAYVISGKFKSTNGGKTKILSAGDAVISPKNTMHGAECLEEGILLDIFSPKRDDFL